MRVIEVIPSFANESSGPSYSVPALCSSLIRTGADVELHYVGERVRRNFDFNVINHNPDRWMPRSFGASRELWHSLVSACQRADVIQTNSLWMAPNIYPDAARKGSRCKFVIMPRGTLSPWALSRSRLKKFISGHLLGQYRALRNADMFVATAEAEYEDIRHQGYRQPIAVIPNGVDIPNQIVSKDKNRHLIFLSRIHPTKGVDMLLRAWKVVQGKFPAWDLRIAGPLDSFARQMEHLSQDLGCQRCQFVGEVNGEAKRRLYGESDCLVLPTHSENFGMVVAESLSNGTPVICSKGAPWSGLETNECGLWIDIGVEPLVTALSDMMSRSRQEMIDMGARGRNWMQSDFSWDRIGRDLLDAYRWLCNGGVHPDCVRLD